jgi:hypothetical protein
MQELINSMVRFSAAMTLFGMQQFQNAMSIAGDTQAPLNKLRDSLDAMTNTVAAQLDEANKPTLQSVTNLGTDMVNRTFETVNVQALDPRQMAQTTGDLMRKTTESVTGIMKKAADAVTVPPDSHAAGEPRPAADALKRK